MSVLVRQKWAVRPGGCAWGAATNPGQDLPVRSSRPSVAGHPQPVLCPRAGAFRRQDCHVSAITLQITTTSLPDATVRQPYSFQLQATGGTRPTRGTSTRREEEGSCRSGSTCRRVASSQVRRRGRAPTRSSSSVWRQQPIRTRPRPRRNSRSPSIRRRLSTRPNVPFMGG